MSAGVGPWRQQDHGEHSDKLTDQIARLFDAETGRPRINDRHIASKDLRELELERELAKPTTLGARHLVGVRGQWRVAMADEDENASVV